MRSFFRSGGTGDLFRYRKLSPSSTFGFDVSVHWSDGNGGKE